jgi:hypothetical protein
MVKEYRYYTYKITFRDLPGYFYYGRRKDNGKPYFGSPSTFKCLWKQYEPEIQILQWYKTEQEVKDAEDSLIGHTWKQEWSGRRYSLNRNYKGHVDEEVCREAGKKGGAVRAQQMKENGPWNKGKKTGPNLAVSNANRKRVITDETREKLKEAGRKNKGRKRPDLSERNKDRKGLKFPRDTNGRFACRTSHSENNAIATGTGVTLDTNIP